MPRDLSIGREPEEGRLELRRLLEDPEPILKQLGAVLVSTAQKAFLEERLGDIEWPGRYPDQPAPVLNVAGAVKDLAGGGSVKARRFQRRPVLRDTGNLMQSLDDRSITVRGKHTIEVGSKVPYAATHQWGGWSRVEVTDTAKQGIRSFLKTRQGSKYSLKLWPILKQDALEFEVHERPFLGITRETERDLADVVEDAFAEAAGGS